MNRSNIMGIFGILLALALTLSATSTGVSAVNVVANNITYGGIWYRNNISMTANVSLNIITINISTQNTTYPQIGNYTQYRTEFTFQHNTTEIHANLTHINFTLPDKNIAISKPIALFNSTSDFSTMNNLANLTLLIRNNSEGYQIYSARLWNISGAEVQRAVYEIREGYNNWTLTYWLPTINITSISNASSPGYIEETWHVKNHGENLTITEANLTFTPYQKQWDIKTGITSVKVNGTTYTRDATSDTGFSILVNMSSVYSVVVRYGMTYSQSGTPSSGSGVEPIAIVTPTLTQQAATLILFVIVAIVFAVAVVAVVVLYRKGYFR